MARVYALRGTDLRAVLDLVYQLGADASWTTDPPPRLLAALGRLIGADVSSYTRVDHRTSTLTGAVVVPAERNMAGSPAFKAAFDQHPGLSAYRTGRLRLGVAAAMTDLASEAQLRRLPLYRDFYRPLGTIDQLLCMVTLDRRHGTALALNRSRRGFSDRDRAVLDLFTPHLAQAVAHRRRTTELTEAVHRLSRRADRLDTAFAALPGLTRAERAVVEQAATGLSDRDIGRNLTISPRTVQKHLENVYRKLGVSGRASLVGLLSRETS